MFNKKRKNLVITCDKHLDLYDGCNIGCEMCKFNQNIKNIKEITINFDEFINQKVLISYKTDPYVKDDYLLVKNVINKLHENNCIIVFLTRKVNSLKKQLYLFNKNDFIGVSISENSSKNSELKEIISTFKEAKKHGLKTWISLEPILTSEYANDIISQTKNITDFIRIGKDDLIDYNWNEISNNIIQYKNIFIKR